MTLVEGISRLAFVSLRNAFISEFGHIIALFIAASSSKRALWRPVFALMAAMYTRKSYYFPQQKTVECTLKSKEAAAREMGIAQFQTKL